MSIVQTSKRGTIRTEVKMNEKGLTSAERKYGIMNVRTTINQIHK